MADASRGANARMTVDLEAQVVVSSDGARHPFEVDAHRRRCLLEGLDDIALTLENVAAIDGFEGAAAQSRPWI